MLKTMLHQVACGLDHLSRLVGLKQGLCAWYRFGGRRRIPSRDLHVFSASKGRNGDDVFVFHAPSGTRARVDEVLGALLRLSTMEGPQDQVQQYIEQVSASSRPEHLIAASRTYKDVVRLFDGLDLVLPVAQGREPRKGELLMFGNLTCNMACPYCLSREAQAEATAGNAPKLMPLETAYQSIHFIARQMAGRADNVYINFTLGGEPLLSMERYQHLRDYCASVSRESGIPVTLNMNTNGTAFSDAFLKYAEANGVLMAVSIDGPKDIHDSMRPFVSGKGTYDTIVKNLPRVLGSNCPGLSDAAAGAVLTARNPYPKRVYQHLIELGFRHVVVTPVRDFPHLEWSLNAETVEAFKNGYTEYAEWLLECLVNEDDRIYAAIVEHDFFGRFLIRVVRGTKQPYRCEAGRTTFGVSVDGVLYPCENFVKLEEFRLGDVFNGIDPQKQAEFLRDTLIDQKPVCKECWARYQCGGGCYFTAALANGDHRIPHAAKCDLIRHCVELSIWIVAELAERNPNALQRLAQGVFSATSPQVVPPSREQVHEQATA